LTYPISIIIMFKKYNVLVVMSAEHKKDGMQKPIVRLTCGLLEGFQESGIFKFYGVPYALPPIGELRWRAPRPVKPWKAIKKATAFTPMAYQISHLDELKEVDKKLVQSEDCLYLNVWTPSISTDERLPVMVWIHGGGFLNGSGSLSDYDGTELAKRGVVVVGFNYRLGPLGFMARQKLGSEGEDDASGNYGMLDQIAVLEWVKNNISSFGGNPGSVTIFGESAGAMSVGLLSGSPRALGLFHRAICQSGGMLNFPREIPRKKALRYALEFQKACGASDVETMRHLSPEDIIRVAQVVSSNDEMPREMHFAPILDNVIIKDQDKTLAKRAKFPLIIGYNKDEATWFMQMMPPITKSNYREILQRNFGQRAIQMLDSFLVNSDEAARKAFISVYTCNLFTIYVHEIAGLLGKLNGDVYVYRLDRVAPKNRQSGLDVGHGEDIAYVLGHIDVEGYADADKSVSDTMMKYWVQFSKTGNPNTEGLPEWPKYIPGTNKYLVFGDEISVRTYHEDNPLRTR
jgi:para-nitrobenzyl esterase